MYKCVCMREGWGRGNVLLLERAHNLTASKVATVRSPASGWIPDGLHFVQ